MTRDAAPITPARVRAHVFRYPVSTPVKTSFGTMHDRPAVLVEVEDSDGAVGWGEVWCNFPACGAEHRARLVETVLAPLLTARAFADPAQAFAHLEARTAVLAIQTGEPGPLAQAIAGLDIALCDLAARRAGQPLWAWLGGSGDRIGVYASGINPENPEDVVARKAAEGYRAFKLKVGFDDARDVRNALHVRELLGAATPLMADANQGWDLPRARQMAQRLGPAQLDWLEEPLRADRPAAEWAELAQAAPMPLAGGENIAGVAAFKAALAARSLRVMQPDLAKWGGFSGCLPVARAVVAAGLRYCPHYLGAGIGLQASAHLLAAVPGLASPGLLEVDANDNPLRSLLSPALATLHEGRIALGGAPGLGVTPDLAALRAACAAR
ncbi:enolase C-terminal domain-like protein [Bordetella bronchiseptica GA96-01]|uniref:mandelate racemase/muconate lactonizing enzyme family protein n=1 Tax=Bordetella bronchiseptica TaxID=518 RepID=UPI00045A00FB|nr:mandelate racemase/muconate lactonizing enzyme family protein [Bordetella bronchiseptica]AZW31285.1 mandelate racemase/muconate lactonizing enzyme family protein [Bordetella bronchiseptica]KCV45175.1 enolase C-terminal domain-like protein [Bordetella bronchiseptica 345]KDC39134.1 enolase C-terminal domain-like protein [Bordetella bronchiseptica GA96-01]